MKRVLLLLFVCMGSYVVSWAQMAGSGTEEDPYQVKTADDLFDVRMNLSAHYVLMNDIDLTQWIEEDNPNQGWNPIANFKGVFNGNNKTIKGLYINRSSGGLGLFSSTTNAIIKNLSIESPVIISEGSGIGALIGTASSTNISDITIISPKIKSHGSTGSIAGSYSGNISGNNRVDYAELECTGSDVGGAFGSISSNISNLVLTAPKVTGGARTGGIAGSSTMDIKDITIIFPTINGAQHTGGLVGNWTTTRSPAKRYLDNNCIMGGAIRGGTYVGGIVGYADKYYMTSGYERYSYITSNYCSSSITATTPTGYVGGICGYITGTYWSPKYSSITTYQYQTPIVQYNRFDGEIKGNVIGGVIGYAYTAPDNSQNHNYSHSGNYIQNIVTGSLDGNTLRGVFGYSTVSGGSFSNNIVCFDLMTATTSIQRIGQSGSNYASLSMAMLLNGEEYTVDDGGVNGTGFSLRMLKRKNTYIGFGFDFDLIWSIVEGETLPYNINQSTPPTIESCVSGINAKASGSASGNGTVYVFVNDNMIEGTVVNGKWEVGLGEVAEGTVVKVSVETEGKKPSIVIRTKAEDVGVDVVLDENSLSAPSAAANADVRVLRTIKANEWNTICLPFAMTEAQVKECFGDDAQLADFTNWSSEEDDAGAIVGIDLNFETATAIEANHPYIIKVSAPITEFTVEDVTLEPEEEPVVQVGRKASERGRFYGTYIVTQVPEENLFLSGNKFWYSKGKTTIKGYRGYFELRDVLDAYYDGSEVKVNVFIDDEETGIKSLTPALSQREGAMYNLAGQRVGRNYKGIVIENGMKVKK